MRNTDERRAFSPVLTVILLVGILVLTGFFSLSAVWAAEDETSQVTQADIAAGHWSRSGSRYSYVLKDGTKLTGWQKIRGKTYWFGKDGFRVTGQKKIGGSYYFFGPKGVRKTGWKTVNGKRMYFNPKKNGARARGMTKIKKKTYFFKKNGAMKTGWLKKSGKYYFFLKTGQMVTGWKTIGGKRYYFDTKDGHRASGVTVIDDREYCFDSNGLLVKQGFQKDGSYIDAGGQKLKKSTLKQFLKTALKPVGSTMYVWGGGWNISDTGADITARTIGVSPQWRKFFLQQNEYYDYNTTRYQTKNGLDCSGFVGWTIYNAFNTTSGNAGYVMLAQTMARNFSGYGWGSYTSASAVKDFRAGDIMSSSGHVYIVIGQCNDGSVVLVHSSPKGVMISGTATRSGKADSKAVKLAEKYMKKYYPKWMAKYPDVKRSSSYLTSYSQMRWYLKGKKRMMSDPEGYAGKTAAQILADLFGE